MIEKNEVALRDDIAVVAWVQIYKNAPCGTSWENIATAAYNAADAMIAEGNKRHEADTERQAETPTE